MRKTSGDFLRPTASHKDKLNRTNRKTGGAFVFLWDILIDL